MTARYLFRRADLSVPRIDNLVRAEIVKYFLSSPTGANSQPRGGPLFRGLMFRATPPAVAHSRNAAIVNAAHIQTAIGIGHFNGAQNLNGPFAPSAHHSVRSIAQDPISSTPLLMGNRHSQALWIVCQSLAGGSPQSARMLSSVARYSARSRPNGSATIPSICCSTTLQNRANSANAGRNRPISIAA